MAVIAVACDTFWLMGTQIDIRHAALIVEVGMQFVTLMCSVLLCLGIGFAGSFAVREGLGTWYGGLRKPSWNPPNQVFAPVWTALYFSMGVSAWLCWREVGIGYGYWLFTFAFQLLLNLAWSYIFFVGRNLGLALVEVVVLWIWIAVTIVVFANISPLAAWLLAPYLGWVTFASVLNWKIWRLNQPVAVRT